MNTHLPTPLTIVTVLLIMVPVSPVAQADCHADVNTLYNSFKGYREQINTATTLEDLTRFFSSSFNQYFTTRLRSTESEARKQRALTQYWDNLTIARDIAIVFDYSAYCINHGTRLTLVAILSSDTATQGREVDLWNVTIHYVNADNAWMIDSIEYEKLHAGRNYSVTDIKDNFVKIR